MDKAISTYTNIVQEEIVKKNYSLDDFFDFFMSSETKSENDLLDENEFKRIIEDFKKEHKPKELPPEQPTVTIKFNMVDFFKSLNPKLEIVKKEPIEAIPDEKIEGNLAIKCKQLEKTQLNGKEVKCIISEAKYDDENDMIFKVETPSENWSVSRTYRDFTWLQDQLSNMRPKQPIPELISAYGCETEKKIRKRKLYYQQFLNCILLNEEVKANKALITFLSITDRDEFNKIKEELDDKSIPDTIEEFETLSGTVITDDSPENAKYFTNIQNYAKISSEIYDRMNSNLRDFSRGIKDAVEALECIHKDFETMNLMNRRVLIPEHIVKACGEFGQFAKKWSEVLSKQKDVIKNHIKTYYKFICNQQDALSDECKDRETIEKEYKKKREELYKEKYKLWNKQNIAFYEIKNIDEIDLERVKSDREYAFSVMKTTETKELRELKRNKDMVNANLIQYLKTILLYQKTDMINNMKNFYNEFSDTLSENNSLVESMKKLIDEVENIQKKQVNPQTQPKQELSQKE